MQILGSGQDGGIPHTGCYCSTCCKARSNPEYRRFSPSATVFDEKDGFCYFIDASPDFKHQLDMVREHTPETRRGGKIPVDGILLTHGHYGHIAGLWHLGREVVDEKDLPVFATSAMNSFLKSNCPFSLLIQNGNIRLEEIRSGRRFELDGVGFSPVEVPHRNEVGDTVAYIVESQRRIFYMPDIDRWTSSIIKEIYECDIAFIDGTFFSKNEISRFEDVPHPPMQETVRLLENVDAEIYFTHINHTNPVNRKGREREFIERRGFKIAYDGLILEI